MGKRGWKYVFSYLLLILFAMAMILYVRELKIGLSTKGATLVLEVTKGVENV